MKNTIRYSILVLSALFVLCHPVFSQERSVSHLEVQIRKRCKNVNGKIGVGVQGLDFNDRMLFNDTAYPMQSVYKLPLAIYILHRVDEGVLRLDQPVRIVKSKLEQDTWSPMLTDFKQDTFDLTVSQLLLYSVSKSDNNACDILFAFADGPMQVHHYFVGLGVREMAMAATEAEMHANWDTQYKNWCRPSAMLQVLKEFYSGTWLKPESKALLMKLLVESENSPNRIKGKLPKDAVVAHKTGTGNVDNQGMRSATNDVGIITLPDGRHYALVVYLSNYKGDIKKGESLIADISKIVWDHYTR